MNFIIKLIDFFYQRRKYSFLVKVVPKNMDVFLDVGAHHGDTISEFLSFFSIKKIYAFEPSKNNFDKLQIKVKKLNKRYSSEINTYPFALGKKNEILIMNEIQDLTDGVSNTFSGLNTNSTYFKKKKFITTLFGIRKFINNKVPIKVMSLKDLVMSEKIKKIDLIKIDTEGFEYNTLLGLEDHIKQVKFILFEHHYDNMLIKNYKFGDIHKLLHDNGFKNIFKTKMPLRKSFDYIYENKG